MRGRIEAALYDRMAARFESAGGAELRARTLADAEGRVLEIGAGTGLNLARYPEGVEELVLTEPEPAMVRKIERKLSSASPPVRIVPAPAEALPFEDESFDTVVSTACLCTVQDPPRSLAEVRRVLRPEGRFLFLEHVRSDNPRIARRQDRLNPVWRAVTNGCNCNRATLEAIEEAGFTIEAAERGDLPKQPSWVKQYVLGRATK